MVKKLVIDPGHGGHDPGAVGYGLQEKSITFEIALKLREKLDNYMDVSLTRNGDNSASLAERAGFANRTGADLFISLHVNAGGGTGFESYIYPNASVESRRLSEALHRAVAEFYLRQGFPDRGLKKASFAVLRETVMPAILLENLFIDRQEDMLKLRDPVFREAVAAAIAGGVAKIFGFEIPGELPQQSPHWAYQDFLRLKNAGLVRDDHDLDAPITWGEFSAVIARLMEK